MKRLTDGVGRRLILGNQYATELFDKLHILENIEEELNVELSILFKALENDCIYAKNPYGFDKDTKVVKCHHISIEKDKICGSFSLPSELFNHAGWNIKEYRKTWSLTEGDLL